MSRLNSGSNWVDSEYGYTGHWIKKENIGIMNFEEEGYLTMVADSKNNKISLYFDGEFIDETNCNHDWMLAGGLTDNTIPFTVGFQVGGDTYTEYFGKLDIYACRLYNKVLTAEEIKDNYNATVAYHNILVKEETE